MLFGPQLNWLSSFNVSYHQYENSNIFLFIAWHCFYNTKKWCSAEGGERETGRAILNILNVSQNEGKFRGIFSLIVFKKKKKKMELYIINVGWNWYIESQYNQVRFCMNKEKRTTWKEMKSKLFRNANSEKLAEKYTQNTLEMNQTNRIK